MSDKSDKFGKMSDKFGMRDKIRNRWIPLNKGL